MKYLNEDRLLQSMKKFECIVYLSCCCIMFILIYIYPIFLDLKINDLSSLVQKETPTIITKSPSESIKYFKHNLINFINPYTRPHNIFILYYPIVSAYNMSVEIL